MSVPAAYISVIIIWSTTPLAVYWSSVEAGYIFGVSSRMLIGAILATMAAALLGSGLVWHRRAITAYAVSGFGFFAGMVTVYWSVQFIPTGWVSLIYGLMPILTALMASRWLQEQTLTSHRIAGMAMGLTGLIVIFGSGFLVSFDAVLGIAAVLLSASIHAAVSVYIKRIAHDLPAITLTSGGLIFAAPMYVLVMIQAGIPVLSELTSTTMIAIGYLALFGSVFGFALYYYVLKNVEATRASLITLIAPVMALILGNLINGEPISPSIIVGAVMILSGLALFELGGRLRLFKI